MTAPSVDEQIFFRLGARIVGPERAALPRDLRPALFARFSDMAAVRHDYPIVLTQGDGQGAASLSGILDEVIASAAPKGLAGERLRRSVLRVEREIRALLDAGETGSLTHLWNAAAEHLAPRGGEPLREDLRLARAALTVDGDVVGCDAGAAARIATHLWGGAQARKTATMSSRIDGLARRLADLVKADHLRSQEGRHAESLRAGVGGPHQELFDFERMSALLSAPSGSSGLPAARRARIDRTLAVLRTQRFFASKTPYLFVFDGVQPALHAYRERLGAMADLVRAIAVAELELRGEYVDATHDPYFARYDASSLTPQDLALFPDHLVILRAGADAPADRAALIEGLSSAVSLKIVFVTDDAFGLGAHLATTAMGLGEAFVLQASAAQLYRVRERIADAMAFPGPSLISVFAPALSSLPPYLVAAAATESRAFPTFSYDPAAGPDWAQRFALHDDPQPDRAWPEHDLAFADDGMRRVTERVAFTLADFALCDPRRAGDLALLPDRDQTLVPVARWVEGGTNGALPFIYAVDSGSRLHRLVVDEKLAELTRRCAQAWHRLRELDDLGRERVATPVEAVPAVAAAEAAAPAEAAAVEAAPAAPASDEAYIETPRCTTCNECTNVNPRMFAYNENKQAYIKDRKAGSFKDLVDAAESCQVAIIHPGKPLDPNEPGLEDLVKRAEQFR